MAWDWQKTLSDVSQSVVDIFKMKTAYKYGKEAQPLVIETYQKTVLPLVLIIAFILTVFLLKRK